MANTPTPAQKEAVAVDAALHGCWLRGETIRELHTPMGENPYTGLLLSALLDPDASSATVRGLLASTVQNRPTVVPGVASAQWPSRGPDLIVDLEYGYDREVLVVEHKRFNSISHAPGYKRTGNSNAPWQTDVVYERMTKDRLPYRRVARHDGPIVFVVLDLYGKPMEELYPGGIHNEHWIVTSYAQFGAVLRAEYELGARGLVPLLSAIYAIPRR